MCPTGLAFLEVFRGAAGLSAAGRAADQAFIMDLAAMDSRLKHVDVGQDEDLQLLPGSAEGWMHAAPPCRTFTKARRSGQHAKVKVLRSAERPEGFGSATTALANKLACRVGEKALHGTGGGVPGVAVQPPRQGTRQVVWSEPEWALHGVA